MEMKTSLQQMLARLLAEMKASQAEMEARAEARQEKADADAKARHEEAAARQEKMNAELKAAILASFRGSTTCQTETTSSSEEMEATNLEATPEETEAPVELQDQFKEEINAENIGSSEDQCENRCLAVRRRLGAKKRSQDSAGSRQKVSAARKRVIRHAVPAIRKGKIRKCPGKDSVARGVSRGKTLVKSRRLCHKGRRHRDAKKLSCPRTRKTTDRILRKTLDQEVAKLQDVIYWAFWKVPPPPKRKKELQTA
jgi:hypothetical protein